MAQDLGLPIEGRHEADGLLDRPPRRDGPASASRPRSSSRPLLADGDTSASANSTEGALPGPHPGHVFFSQRQPVAFVVDVLFGSIGAHFPMGTTGLLGEITGKLCRSATSHFVPGTAAGTFVRERHSNPFVSDAAIELGCDRHGGAIPKARVQFKTRIRTSFPLS